MDLIDLKVFSIEHAIEIIKIIAENKIDFLLNGKNQYADVIEIASRILDFLLYYKEEEK